MDLRALNLSQQDLEPIYKAILERKLGYQPFIFSDQLEVGEGHAFMTASSDESTKNVVYWPGGPDSIKELLVPSGRYKEYQQANGYLRTIYNCFISFICENLPGPVGDREFLEFGCNTGYFVQSLAQKGAKRAIGLDQTTNEELFKWFNRHLGTSAEFQFAEWDSYSHSVRYAEMPKVDVVLSIAVLCHIGDLLHHLTYLCTHAKEAVFIWAPVREEDELLVSYGPPSQYTLRAWPLCFDHLILPTRKLVQLCLEKCGFEKMIFLPQFEGVNDWYKAVWNNHIGVLALRTSHPKTIFDGGRRRLTIPPDALLKSEKYIPLDQGDPASPKMIYSTKENYNILFYGGFFYAVPHLLGSVDLGEIKDYASQGIIRSDNLEVLFEKIPHSRPQCRVTASSNHFKDQDLSLLISPLISCIWHATSPPQYPEWLKLTYDDPFIVSKISFQSQDNAPSGSEHQRAPRNFKVQASEDGKAWQDLLTVENFIFHQGGDWKSWSFENNNPYTHYRLLICENNGDPDFLTVQNLKLVG
jgi:SAM-dependent methyltransferase